MGGKLAKKRALKKTVRSSKFKSGTGMNKRNAKEQLQ